MNVSVSQTRTAKLQCSARDSTHSTKTPQTGHASLEVALKMSSAPKDTLAGHRTCCTVAMFKQVITACCPWTCGSRCWGRRASWLPPPHFPCRAPPPGAENCTAQRGLNGQVNELADTLAGTSRGNVRTALHGIPTIVSTAQAVLTLSLVPTLPWPFFT